MGSNFAGMKGIKGMKEARSVFPSLLSSSSLPISSLISQAVAIASYHGKREMKGIISVLLSPLSPSSLLIVFLLLPAAALASGFDPKKADITVSADGDIKTVQAAIDRVPEGNTKRFVIYIKPGVYKEQVRIPASKPYITFIGDSAETTRLTFDLSNKAAGSTSASYSVYIGGHDFYAENISFENSFGTGSQAVAVLAEADRVVFKKCRFLGWQDTLYAKGGRQYYYDSYIEGHVDFIFGQAAAVFENCVIHSKGDGYIAAPMRFADTETSGYVFIRSKLTGENIDKGVYLGRPWRAFGRTIYIETEMGAHIRPEGWNNWSDPAREKTAYFAEYGSTGAGGIQDKRVSWMHQLRAEEAAKFEATSFLKGADGWNPRKAGYNSKPAGPPEFKLVRWNDVLKQQPLWYAVDEATRIADNVLQYQRANGGWEKNVDMAAMLTQGEKEKLAREKSNTDTTIDNSATTTQLAYLAKLVMAKNIDRHKDAFFRGLDFLLAMQYKNGGFPQFYPLKKDYSREITFNDNAMINALKLLRDVARKKEDYLFVDEARRLKAEKAVEKGAAMILKLQVEVNGEKTVWAAQYDENTLKPANARKFEPVSLTSGESVGIVRFLMLDSTPDAATREAIEAAIKWFEKNKITGIRWDTVKTREGIDRVVIKDAKAPPLWARFYEMPSMKAIFIGRDAVIKYSVAEIEHERRNGYGWYVDSPRDLLEKDYPKWKEKVSRDGGDKRD